MDKQITAVLVGAGNRANVYASVSFTFPEKLKVVGIVDPNPERREYMKNRFGVPEENCFDYVDALCKREKFADVVINGTMDWLHVDTAIPVLEKGYDLLLEKPFAVNEEEMNRLRRVAKKNGSKVVICHVLRYTRFYRAIKEHILNGDIGDIVSIEMNEHVNYHHMSVSYVRGKWRSEEICFAPMLLAKSCHDLDLMMWMMNHTKPVAVSSFGGDFQYGPDRKPEGAGNRCMVDCPYNNECIYSAEKHYIDVPRWNQYVWEDDPKKIAMSVEEKIEHLKTDNHFGECLWNFDRGGNVDHQTLIVNFENGATGSFSMIGGSAKSERNIHIIGTKGEIKGGFEDSKYVLRKMTPSENYAGFSEQEFDLKVTGDMIGAKGGHGGGDENLVLDFVEYINGHEPSVSCTTLEDSVVSHHTVFCANESRKSGKTVLL